MKTNRTPGLSRRHFLMRAALGMATTFFLQRRAVADGESPVTVIRNAAATAKITLQKLRVNVSVLQGPGGNIDGLTGRDCKALVDAGIAPSRPRLTDAL